MTENQFDFEIKQKAKIKVSIYGNEYILLKPTVSQASYLSTLSSLKDDKDTMNKCIEFMEVLGFPKELSNSMELDHFLELIEFILSKVKKN